MTWGELAQVVTAIAALAAAANSWRNSLKLKVVEAATNGMKAELEKLAYKRGRADEKELHDHPPTEP